MWRTINNVLRDLIRQGHPVLALVAIALIVGGIVTVTVVSENHVSKLPPAILGVLKGR